MVLYLPDWTNRGVSFILQTVNLFRHYTLFEHGLLWLIRISTVNIYIFQSKPLVNLDLRNRSKPREPHTYN